MTLPNDPYFDENAVVNRIKNLWMQYQLAHMTGDLEPLKPYFSSRLYSAEENILRDDQRADRKRYAIRPAILQSNLARGATEHGRETLICRMLTRTRPVEVRISSGKTVSGEEETFWREEWTMSRPAGALTPAEGSPVSVNCPGCGAPLSIYKSAKCPFCGSLVPVSDFNWTIERIERRKEENP